MHEVNIIGEVIPYELYDMNGYVNLQRVENQLNVAAGKPIKVNINSLGGDTEEGFMIYTALRKYAKEHNVKVTTYAKGRCCSIATVIFLAGDSRIGNKFIEPFVHNAWTYAMGDSKEMTRAAVELDKVNNKIANHYADHTDLTIDEALDLMANNTYIDNEFALQIRFVTEIEEVVRPAALSKILNKNKVDMNTNDKNLLNKIKNLFAVKNAVEVFTAANETLTFPDLEEGATPAVGDRATIDGKPAEGEIVLADGTKYDFAAGVLESIELPDESDNDDETVEVVERLEAENKALRDQLEAQNKKLNKVIEAQANQQKQWDSLKNLVSSVVVDDADNDDKSAADRKSSFSGVGERMKNRVQKSNKK